MAINGTVTATALSGATGTITDSSKSFATDEHIGRTFTITSGTAIGQSGTITTNTPTSFSFASSFPIQNVTAETEGTVIENWETGDINGWTADEYWAVLDITAHTGVYSIIMTQGPE